MLLRTLRSNPLDERLRSACVAVVHGFVKNMQWCLSRRRKAVFERPAVNVRHTSKERKHNTRGRKQVHHESREKRQLGGGARKPRAATQKTWVPLLAQACASGMTPPPPLCLTTGGQMGKKSDEAESAPTSAILVSMPFSSPVESDILRKVCDFSKLFTCCAPIHLHVPKSPRRRVRTRSTCTDQPPWTKKLALTHHIHSV